MSRVVPFSVPSSDGFPLRGAVHLPDGDTAPCVLVVHGFKGFGNWGFFPLLCDRLAEAGLAACRFNLSSSGVGEDGETFSEKERFEQSTISREVEDILLMADLAARGELPGAPTRPGPVGLLGHSRGGGNAILAAAREPRVAALVTWAAVATVVRFNEEQVAAIREQGFWRVENARTGDVFEMGLEAFDDFVQNAEDLDIISGARSLEIPALVIHGTADKSVPFVEGLALAEAFHENGSFLPLEGAGHTFGATHPMPGEVPSDLEEGMLASAAHLAAHLIGSD